jgi:Tol biopolymer transport system component
MLLCTIILAICFNCGLGEVDPAVSPDELTLYFASSRPDGLGGSDLWMMTRATKHDSWSEPMNLGPMVNSPWGDWCPRPSADGLSLYFHSNRAGGEGDNDIWMTTRISLDAPWQAATNLGPRINTGASDMNPSISSDGLTLYFDRVQAELFEARRSSAAESWENAETVSSSLNGLANDSHPCISPDGLSLYFCSNRTGGYGSMDIYVATRHSLQDPWGEPVNAGDAINTPQTQCAPCISSDGLTLYYDDGVAVHTMTRASFSKPWGEPSDSPGSVWAGDPVYFSDPNLKAAVEESLWIVDPTPTDMLGLTCLECDAWCDPNHAITDLTGLAYAVNLQSLTLMFHRFTDISPLTGLVNLRRLDLEQCPLSDISSLSGLDNLSWLTLHKTRVSDISPLVGLASLSFVDLRCAPLNQDAYDRYIPQLLANRSDLAIFYDSYRQQPQIVVITSSSGGSVIYPGEGIFLYDYDETAYLEAEADPGFVFENWSGTYSSNENPAVFPVKQDHEIQANFASPVGAQQDAVGYTNNQDRSHRCPKNGGGQP